MAAITQSPHSAEQWRATTALFGAADWDTGALAEATVADAGDAHPAGDVAAAVAGDRHAARRLGVAGVVAVRAGGVIYEVHETVDSWELVAQAGTPDVAALAMTAVLRAARLAGQRRGGRTPP